MYIHGNTIDFSWSVPWSFHGILEYGHAFIISSMEHPWHGFSMYFPWLIHVFSSRVLSVAIEKICVFHKKTWISMVNMMGFQRMGMLFHGKPMDMTMGFHGILVTMDFQ